jgi:hypothetical protein
MTDQKQATASPERLIQRFGSVVLVELPVWQLLVLATAVGALWAASIFDWDFVTGRDVWWRFPHGTIRGAEYDLAAPFAAYLYYIQSPWHLPLFEIPLLGAPAGVNGIFTDFVPIVALIGKMIRSLTGAVVNLYGAYVFLCFVLSGVMMTLVLIAAKIRCALAVVLAAIFADVAPALLWRWGHIPLMSQFLLIGALAMYVFSLNARGWRGLRAAWIVYLVVTYLANIYLFVMVGTVWLCTIIQRRANGLAKTREVLGTGVLTVAVVSIVIMLSGQFASETAPFSDDYGFFSMNLASPFVPQSSGLFPLSEKVIDATGGQYEGFNYLGLGLLLATCLVLPFEINWLRRNLKRHFALSVAFGMFIAFAISHRVFAGDWLLLELPLPRYIHPILGIFRSSGRFFWLICYAQIATVIIVGFRRAQPVIAMCLAGAAIIQLFDVQPLRDQIVASVANGPVVTALEPRQIASLVAEARQIDVVPSFQCTWWQREHRPQARRELAVNVEVMLAAARENVPTNTFYVDRFAYGASLFDLLRNPSRAREMLTMRGDDYCEQEIERARSGGPRGDVIVLLSDRPVSNQMAPGVTCSRLSWARYCQRSENPREN